MPFLPRACTTACPFLLDQASASRARQVSPRTPETLVGTIVSRVTLEEKLDDFTRKIPSFFSFFFFSLLLFKSQRSLLTQYRMARDVKLDLDR